MPAPPARANSTVVAKVLVEAETPIMAGDMSRTVAAATDAYASRGASARRKVSNDSARETANSGAEQKSLTLLSIFGGHERHQAASARKEEVPAGQLHSQADTPTSKPSPTALR
jgi:hypothetical protein